MTNSNAAVAQLALNGGLTPGQTLRIVAGQSTTPLNAPGGIEFDPLAVGSTALLASIANFTSLPSLGLVITVIP